MQTRETIFALASGGGTSGIAVVRISGPVAFDVARGLTGAELPPPRTAGLRVLRDEGGRFLDQALVLPFAAGAGYTGDETVELHLHGGRAVVQLVLEALGREAECRLAEPGEFTRRAFENGRMDLAAVEALGDLIQAETEAQHRQAARALGGALHRRAEAWRADLLRAAALVEVTIDWADEEVPEDVSPEVFALLERVRASLADQITLAEAAERMRHGFEVAIVGAPNAGKSTLLNALAGREAAITSSTPGTTRDVIELRYDLGGLPVIFLDMAGLRETSDPVERIGVERALTRADAAELRLFLRSADAPPGPWEERSRRKADLTVWTKADLSRGAADLTVSAISGAGLSELLDAIEKRLRGRVETGGLVSHLRQRKALEAAVSALDRALEAGEDAGAELLALEIRSAMRALERMIGRAGAEEVLDAVFAGFCLGK